MKLFEQIERLNLIHKLISEERTGSPESLACKISISKRQLYNIIDELKLLGAPIYYNSMIGSYSYSKKFIFKIDVSLSLASEKELNDINGGVFLSECNFFSLNPANLAIVNHAG